MKLHFAAEHIPYAYFLDEGVVRLRAGGTMVGFEIRGMGHEDTADVDVQAACERFSRSINQFGTGDLLHTIAHRVPATEYPVREIPNPAARMIDEERAHQFSTRRYYLSKHRIYISNEDEYELTAQLKALFFA